MKKVIAVLVMTMLEVLIIVHHLILIIEKKNNLVLGEGPTFGINGSHGAAENKY